MSLDLTMCESKHGNYIMLYSACDYDLICLQNSGWCPDKSGYAVFNATNEFVHNAIAKRMSIYGLSDVINHKDTNPNNNQRGNLEPATFSQNSLAINCKIRPHDSRVPMLDDEDFNLILSYGWTINRAGYVRMSKVPYCKVFLHRLIALKAGWFDDLNDPRMIDHEDGNGLNCHRYNLRVATDSQNAANRKLVRGKCGYFGVYETNNHKYAAKISVKGMNVHLGTFECSEEAAIAYDKAAIAHQGEFAQLNFKREDYAKLYFLGSSTSESEPSMFDRDRDNWSRSVKA